MNTTICQAIKEKRLIQFYYDGGTRVVEPHMVAENEAGHYSLSAWFVRGYSSSGGQGWREYLLSGISSLAVLDEVFSGPRPGYNPSGGKKFPNVICRL
jgi:predicted DNA-binding transcriptional regulator YafY